MAKMLWKPTDERVKNSNMYRFMNFINKKHSLDINEYRALYKWSIENIPEFWASFWQFADIKYSKMYDTVIDDVHKMPGTKWFEGARLNFAENLLRFRDDHTAFIFRGETQKSSKMSYSELYDTVARLAKSLKQMGIKPGDRVA
ncbi:MAG: acetyl-coenzyme A synthetase N-terminal domain-containing protein, partial [Thermodesulfobacteriota bacterium]|nr:acetyl-coenzyme A synthetase N-terminal domain-containing protein [Thermodesulfobacteriota bacterium]